MFAAVLGIHPEAPGAALAPSQRCAMGHYRNRKMTLDAKLEEGERVLIFLHEKYPDVADNIVRGLRERRLSQQRAAQALAGGVHSQEPSDAGSQPTGAGSPPPDDGSHAGAQSRFPHGFWKRYVIETLHLRSNPALQLKCRRALDLYLEHKEGSLTRVGLRAGRKGTSCRNSNAACNPMLAPALGFHLLQFFY